MVKLPVVCCTSWNQIESLTSRLLGKYQPKALKGEEAVNIELFYELDIPGYLEKSHGIEGFRCGYTDLQELLKDQLGEEILGYTNAKLKVSYVDSSLVETNHQPTIRRGRATMAHEAYHCIKHVPILSEFFSYTRSDEVALFRKEKRELKPYEDPEWQAWAFAGAFMMPRDVVQDFLADGWTETQLAEFFDVNPAFVRYRLNSKPIKN